MSRSRVTGTIACYSPRTGAGIIKDDEGREHFFSYSGVDSDLLKEMKRVKLTRFGIQDVVELVGQDKLDRMRPKLGEDTREY